MRALVFGSLLALIAATPAQAAFPGQNGKIAFSEVSFATDYEIYLINPDGSGKTPLTSNSAHDFGPAWSADGTKIAFSSNRDGNDEIYTMNADGTGQTRVTNNPNDDFEPSWSPTGSQLVFTRLIGTDQDLVIANSDGSGEHTIADAGPESQPAWSPDGGKIAFFRSVFQSGGPYGGIYLVNPNGTGEVLITPSQEGGRNQEPNWSPDGGRIVFSHDGCGSPCEPDATWEVTTMNTDGSDRTRIECCFTSQPAWSPDRTKVVYYKGLDCLNACQRYDLATVNSSGGSVTVLPNTGDQPDWQPLPTPYPRPKGATPMRISLVPAYASCTSPNRTHGPPLAYGSCNPPAQESAELTVGDAPANMSGFVSYKAILGDPSTPADEADLALRVEISDVRVKGTLADYAGDVQAQASTRMTDHDGGVTSTASDVRFPLTTPCTPTADPSVGSTCSLTTTLDTLIPGAVVERRRTILQLGQVRVVDGGPDGDVATEPNTVFLRQGVFVP